MGIIKIIKKNRMIKNKLKASALENNSPAKDVKIEKAVAQPQPVVTQVIQKSAPVPKQEKAKTTAKNMSVAVKKDESPKKTTSVKTSTSRNTNYAEKQELASQKKTSGAKPAAPKKATAEAKPVVATTNKKTITKETKSDVAIAPKKAATKDAKPNVIQSSKKTTVAETKSTVNEKYTKDTAASENEIKNGYTGKFEINKSKDGKKFFFNLYASNKVGIATSQMYSSSQGALNGVKSVIANAPTAPIEDQSLKKYETLPYPKWEIYVDNGGKFRFRLHASNGSCVCHSQGYTTKTACKNGIISIIRSSKNAEIDKTYIAKKDDV